MLRLEGLRVEQGSFAIGAHWPEQAPGIIALIGPSGAGKSTLISAIGGFLPATAGRILWNGQDITGLAPGQRPTATLFQDNNLFPHLTIAQNIALALRRRGMSTADQKARIAEGLAQVDLAGLGDRKPAQLSGGQQSRAALARVLLQDRPVVLLDEPFAALGPALKAEMLDLVKRVLSDRLVLMITHDPQDAARIADRVSVVADGEATSPEPTQGILQNPPDSLRAYLGQ
ncbi:ATP-binding cassette domain-containing protein [Loktanella sp. IMCC34160]|uniref:thiamine ABC transporter ATP-binding protein n=1 Tax=Loktanella sp. IMCC34160 TaxID=2510646 RepID=UPI00101E1B5F|nr:ATP-binding cassette domain-containing protein [Loktanella sp. IMCC34160]RYG91263.1 ATP-binding cassette domain-containing protein [Loktanella sp. IMCC34160]